MYWLVKFVVNGDGRLRINRIVYYDKIDDSLIAAIGINRRKYHFIQWRAAALSSTEFSIMTVHGNGQRVTIERKDNATRWRHHHGLIVREMEKIIWPTQQFLNMIYTKDNISYKISYKITNDATGVYSIVLNHDMSSTSVYYYNDRSISITIGDTRYCISPSHDFIYSRECILPDRYTIKGIYTFAD